MGWRSTLVGPPCSRRTVLSLSLFFVSVLAKRHGENCSYHMIVRMVEGKFYKEEKTENISHTSQSIDSKFICGVCRGCVCDTRRQL